MCTWLREQPFELATAGQMAACVRAHMHACEHLSVCACGKEQSGTDKLHHTCEADEKPGYAAKKWHELIAWNCGHEQRAERQLQACMG